MPVSKVPNYHESYFPAPQSCYFHTFDGNKGPARVNDLDISWVGFLGGISPLPIDPNKVHQSP
jgi:hypothetical protein